MNVLPQLLNPLDEKEAATFVKRGSKRSVALRLGAALAGRVAIPEGYSMPRVGQVVEIRYLYFRKAFVQPFFLGFRRDVLPAECTMEAQHVQRKD